MTDGSPATVVLGFDALSREYLDRFDLPAFQALEERGVSTDLESTFPPWTGSAWPSMYTGVDPGSHGAYSFFDFRDGYPDDATLIDRNQVRAPALWNYLSTEGSTVAVLNMPITHPAESIDGALVPGYLAPEDAPGYPPGIRAELSDALGEAYHIYAEKETGEADESMLRSYVDLIDHRRRAARELIRLQNPDVALLQVQKTDTVFHQFDEVDAFRRIYEAADRFLETVLEVVDAETNVVVCSDHGIGPTNGYNVYVNEILREAGLVEGTRTGSTPTLGTSKGKMTGRATSGDDSKRALGTQAVSALATGLARIGVHPGDVYDAARYLGIEDVVRRLLPAGSGAVEAHVDWASSQAYCRSGPELGIRLNIEGREPSGAIPPEEYEATREQVTAVLEAARTPAGSPAFDWVKPREEVYDGPYAEEACDVLFQPAGMDHLVATNLLGTGFVPIDKYNHKSSGVFIGAGPAFGTAVERDRLSLTDIAPVVMALAGQPVPERMTGEIPPDLLTIPWERRAYEGVEYGSEADGSTDEDVKARLADLGYL